MKNIIITTDGYLWYYENQDHLLPTREDEWSYIEILKEIGDKESIFIDVGAHVGRYTIRLAKYYKKVIAIEPHPESVQILRKNIEINKLDNVEVYEYGIGEGLGEGILHHHGGSSTFLSAPSQKQFKVKFTSLDLLITECTPCKTVIKIDVEGLEVAVLKGAKRILNECKPILLIELHELRGVKPLQGIHDEVKKILHDFIELDVGDCHKLYVHRDIDMLANIKKFKRAIAMHWANHTIRNVQKGTVWYYGLPYTWWWGMSQLEFILKIFEHVENEPEWVNLLYKRHKD